MAIDLNKLLKILEDEVGYREGPKNNETKYAREVKELNWANFQPWCATFTCWAFIKAGGKKNTDFPLTASCLSQVSWGRKHGRFFTKPKVGDLVMFGPGGGTHVEIVVKVSGNTITTIGGNTSGSWGGKYWDGNGVYKKTRSASSVYGYVRPVYSGKGVQYQSSRTTRGMSSVRSFLSQQKAVNGMGYSPKLVEDGIYGPKTEAGVKWLQGKVGTTKDGMWGPKTESAYQAYLAKVGKVTVPSGTPYLRRGSKGSRVANLQKSLIKAGERLPRYGADGDFGTETEAALKSFQGKNGLSKDGIYGPKSAAVLRKKVG